MAGDDLYEMLQVSPSAEPEVIDAAYRRLARKYHPDVDKSPAANREMRRLNAAYDILGDADRRRAYDLARGSASIEAHEYRPRYLEEAGRGGGVHMSEMTKGEGGKSAFLAGCLTVIIPGLGQAYVGQPLKGIAVFVGLVVVPLAAGAFQGMTGVTVAGLVFVAYYVAAVVDAVSIARKKSAGRKVGAFEFF